LSIVEHPESVAAAEAQQNVVRDVTPRRGVVYVQDRANGAPSILAQSVERFALSATPANIAEKRRFADMLAPIVGSTSDALYADFSRILDNGKPSQYMNPMVRGLTIEQARDVAAKIGQVTVDTGLQRTLPELQFDTAQGSVFYYTNGFFFIREFYRIYPEGSLFGQGVGFVNAKGEGRYGFEEKYDAQLRGFAGRLRLEKDSKGRLLQQKGSVDGADGTSYELTIDRNLQHFVEQRLAAKVKETESTSGSVIIMDPKTGDILAMANNPDYDPNTYQQTAQQNQAFRFDNPAISQQWEPGSIFKTLIMAAAIDQEKVTPDTKDTFAGSVVVDGYTVNTALRRSYGTETMTDVLRNSDNVAMVWVANKMDNTVIADYVDRFGMGKQTGIDLENEASGSVVPVNQWRDINRATTSFGQGIATTPIQMAASYAPFANGGFMVKPRLVSTIIRADGTREAVPVEPSKAIIKPSTADQVRQMLSEVTMRAHKDAVPAGYVFGGKTGTAEIPKATGGYEADQFNHSFVGIGPSQDPRFIVLVKLEKPNISKVGPFAGTTAVPLFGEISKFLVEYYQIPPTNR
jgi:cell division protein FtsI/penicillin-binding protein 2